MGKFGRNSPGLFDVSAFLLGGFFSPLLPAPVNAEKGALNPREIQNHEFRAGRRFSRGQEAPVGRVDELVL